MKSKSYLLMVPMCVETKYQNGLKTKILIIHHIPSYSDRIKAMLVRLRKSTTAKICIVAFNDTENELEKGGMSCKTPEDYIAKEDYAQWEKKAVDFVKSLGHQKFSGDKTLLKLLEYRSTSLWWFIEADFYRYYVKHAIRYVESLHSIIDKEKPSIIVVIGDGHPLVKVVTAVGKAKNIPIQLLSPGLRRMPNIIAQTFLKIPMPLVRFCFRNVRDFLHCMLRHSTQKTRLIIEGKEETQRKILFASSLREQVVTDPISGEKRMEDSVLGSVVSELGKDEANEIVFLRESIGSFRLRLPKDVYHGRVLYKSREAYLTPKICKAVSVETRLLREKWSQLRNDNSFMELSIYKGVNLWNIARDELERTFLLALQNIVKYIELSKEIMKVEHPDIMVIANELSPLNKALVVACNLRGTPVLAVQHGVIIAVKDVLIYYPSIHEDLNEKPSKRFTFPQKFAVYGECTKEVLVKEIGYPFEERIVITGQPKYDVLAKAGEIFDRERFCADWDINPDKKIVLIGSQTFHIAGNKDIFFRTIFHALKEDPQIQMVIKPHPTEQEEWHKELKKEMDVNAVLLPRKANTIEALYACDALMTFYSTIALEAMMLGKPVITVNLTNQPDPVPYAQSGAAFGVYKTEDIAPAVREVLENPETRKQLEIGRQEYLYKQFYKLDGQATRRVVELVYKMIDENNIYGGHFLINM